MQAGIISNKVRIIIVRTVLVMMLFLVFNKVVGQTATDSKTTLLVRKCNDFTITGQGTDAEWTKAEWKCVAAGG